MLILLLAKVAICLGILSDPFWAVFLSFFLPSFLFPFFYFKKKTLENLTTLHMYAILFACFFFFFESCKVPSRCAIMSVNSRSSIIIFLFGSSIGLGEVGGTVKMGLGSLREDGFSGVKYRIRTKHQMERGKIYIWMDPL